jgi:acetylornithine deacetylase
MASVDYPATRPAPAMLGPVASSRGPALYVIKIGSASQAHDELFSEIAALRDRNARILVVAGGAAGIATHYAGLGRVVRMMVLGAGNEVRHATADEMPHIVAAYDQVTLPAIRERLEALGLTVHAAVAARGDLVSGALNPPIKASVDGRRSVVRDHRAGTVRSVAVDRLGSLLDVFDVVCLSPPIADEAGGTALNVDADVLAAELSNVLEADHLRLVTNTPGLLRDPADPASRIANVAPGEGALHARGRMRQKVRAAEIGLAGPADVAICGPNALSPRSGSRFWKAAPPDADLTLLSRAVEIASVSGDERELAEYLTDWCARRGIDAAIDPAGNFVATRGSGPKRLLLLGHIDTVPYRWPVRWDDETLSGRGCVDAKGSVIGFLQALAAIDPPAGTQLRVVGAVEEESTSNGASWVRDHYPADAVVIGEPSGAQAVTIGYHGLLKVRVRCEHPVGHTAGREALTAADRIADIVTRVREAVLERAEDALVATLGVHAVNAGDRQVGEAVVDIRVPHRVDPGDLLDIVRESASGAEVECLRSTPASKTSRADPLVRAFTRALKAEGIESPRFLAKKGSCDINTLATTGQKHPWVAYGPGDASLDHTPAEHLHASEVRAAARVLQHAVAAWLDGARPSTADVDDQVPAVAG